MRIVEHRGKWAVRIDGRRFSLGLTATENNRQGAERKAREFLSAKTLADAGETCGEILDAYIADMPNRANPKEASGPYIYAKNAVARFFKGHRPDQVTRDECRAYIAARRALGRSDGTIRKELSVLQAALNWRDKQGPQRFDFPAPPPPRSGWLTRDEFKRLQEAADLPHVALFLHVAICTGARKEAILGLRWDTHINFDKGTIWPGFKAGGKNRAMPIPMTDDVRTALAAAKGRAETDFVIEWAGESLKDIKRALRRCYERAGLTDIPNPAHILRHTAGAWMAQAGNVPMLEISRRLGHTSIRVTERHYAHLHPDYMGASTKALEV